MQAEASLGKRAATSNPEFQLLGYWQLGYASRGKSRQVHILADLFLFIARPPEGLEVIIVRIDIYGLRQTSLQPRINLCTFNTNLEFVFMRSYLLAGLGLREHQIRHWGIELCLKVVSNMKTQ